MPTPPRAYGKPFQDFSITLPLVLITQQSVLCLRKVNLTLALQAGGCLLACMVDWPSRQVILSGRVHTRGCWFALLCPAAYRPCGGVALASHPKVRAVKGKPESRCTLSITHQSWLVPRMCPPPVNTPQSMKPPSRCKTLCVFPDSKDGGSCRPLGELAKIFERSRSIS